MLLWIGVPEFPWAAVAGWGSIMVSAFEHSASILVTDDDRGSRDTLAGLLRDRGFHAFTAECGEEAIDIVRVETIDLLVFDMHMPRMTGLEALQHVRLFNEVLPAILVTADATRDLIRRAFQAQVYSVLPKPVNAGVLLHTLMAALRSGPKPERRPEAMDN